MTCCPANIITFAGVTETNVPYDGVNPFVQVVYFEDGQYYISTIGSQVKFSGGNININHGGPRAGFIVVK